MLSSLNNFDHHLFLAIHHFRCGILDWLMPWVSNRWIWIPLYAILFFILWKRFGKQMLLIAATITLLVLASDQTANFLKDHVKRARPCADPAFAHEQIYTPLGCGGEYGFVSGHAANSAAIAVFLFLLSGNFSGFAPARNRKWWLLLFPWALLICWSRIYLGVHFPFDVLCGMFVGISWGIIFFVFYKKLVPVLR